MGLRWAVPVIVSASRGSYGATVHACRNALNHYVCSARPTEVTQQKIYNWVAIKRMSSRWRSRSRPRRSQPRLQSNHFFGKIFSGSTNDFQKDSLLFLFFGVFGYPRQRKYQGVPKTIKTITPVLNVARMSFAIFEKIRKRLGFASVSNGSGRSETHREIIQTLNVLRSGAKSL